jgi:hypothetical protein
MTVTEDGSYDYEAVRGLRSTNGWVGIVALSFSDGNEEAKKFSNYLLHCAGKM